MASKSEIAKLACVSNATVSNFFSGKGKMSNETRERIIDAAVQLGYPIPNLDEPIRQLNGATLLVVDDITNPHFGNVLKGMNKIAMPKMLSVSMMQMWEDVDDFCRMIIKSGYSAVFFCVSTRLPDSNLELLKQNGIKTAFSWENCVIDFDNLLLQAISYLKDLGHKRIAYLSGLSIADEENIRYTSYVNALQKNGLPFDEKLVIDGMFPFNTDAKSGYWEMKSFLELNVDFTAVITLNDLMAIGCIKALSESGLSVPKDVSVMGCDDIVISEYLNPSLTTLSFSAADMGAMTMYSMLASEESKENRQVTLQTRLVVRKSTGAVAK